jgi:hypothetical protein
MGCLFSSNKERNNNQTEQKSIKLLSELQDILNKNRIEIQQKFYEILYRDISETDGVGFIYGFTKDNDLKWIKIGRTSYANPNKRVDQWKGDILFCQKTLYNKKIETLIHLLFKNINIHRTNEKTGSKEIEWFYFEEYVNVSKILAILIEYVELHCNNTIT